MTFEYNQYHLWDSMNPFNPGYLLSDESKKELTHHKTLDDAINYLYSLDKDAAKKLNQFKKEQT